MIEPNQFERIEQEIAEARRRYDLDRLTTLLNGLPADFPGLGELKDWLIQERLRQANIDSSWSSKNWSQVLKLLADAPLDFPRREEKYQEARLALESKRRAQEYRQKAQEAFDAGRYEQTGEICNQARIESVGDEDDVRFFVRLLEHSTRALGQKRNVKKMLDEADSALKHNDYETAVIRLQSARGLAPDLPEVRQRLAVVQLENQLRGCIRQARHALALGKLDEALNYLTDLPERAAALVNPGEAGGIAAAVTDAKALREEIKNRQVTILYQQAQAAESTGRWDQATMVLEGLQKLQPQDGQLTIRLQQARQNQAKATVIYPPDQPLVPPQWNQAANRSEAVPGRAPYPAQPEIGEVQARPETHRGRTAMVILIGFGAVALCLLASLVMLWLFGDQIVQFLAQWILSL